MGSLFRAAREARGVPLEQAAHETRVRAGRLREIEADDLSRMAPAYARMFLLDYAKYLGIRSDAVREFLPETGELGVDGYEYILNAPANTAHSRRDSRPMRRRYRPLVVAALVVMLAAGSFQLWVTKRKLERIAGTSSPAAAEQTHVPSDDESVSAPPPSAGTLQVEEPAAVFPSEHDAAFAAGLRSDETPAIP